LGAGGDRKVTPGVTGSSRARAPIDPAVWYLGPIGPWGRIVVTRLKYPQKNTSIGLFRRNPTSFIQDVRKDALGRAGEGNAEGSPTGFQHPVRWKINRKSNGLLSRGIRTSHAGIYDNDRDQNHNNNNRRTEQTNHSKHEREGRDRKYDCDWKHFRSLHHSRHEQRSSNNIRLACRQGSLSPTGPHGTRRGSTRSLHSASRTSTSSNSSTLARFWRRLIYSVRP
jgi:hypothetical protein